MSQCIVCDVPIRQRKNSSVGSVPICASCCDQGMTNPEALTLIFVEAFRSAVVDGPWKDANHNISAGISAALGIAAALYLGGNGVRHDFNDSVNEVATHLYSVMAAKTTAIKFKQEMST